MKAKDTSKVEQPPAPTTPPVYLGAEYVNNKLLSDVTFLVEGRTFYAHRCGIAGLLCDTLTHHAMVFTCSVAIVPCRCALGSGFLLFLTVLRY